MLPSMPILFTRDSQDAFGNKIEPSTSFFGQRIVPIPISKPTPPNPEPVPPPALQTTPKEDKVLEDGKKQNEIQEEIPKPDEYAKEKALAASYFTKVQSKYASNPRVPNNKFVEFKDILKTFDPTKESPIDLYRKIEKLFGEDQKVLADEFLLFLTAGQTAQIGRFTDQIMLLQMNHFIELLKSTFARKPTMLRKVLRAITNSLNCGTLEEMRSKVLPHLRSNPRLAELYRSLFPDQRPRDVLYESGADTLHESFLVEDRGYDVWKYDDLTDPPRRTLDAKERLDTVYLQGRVFLQHGRNLRPARVAFPYSKEPYRWHARRLGPAHSRLSPTTSDDESNNRKTKTTPKRTRKTQPKTKKDVNDNNKNGVTDSPKAKKNSKRNQKEKKDDKKKNDKKEDKVKLVKETPVAKVTNSWTRDEDKTMLQTLKGETVSEHVFVRISEQLPHRSVTEIKERFCHVMTLLQQMEVGEVT